MPTPFCYESPRSRRFRQDATSGALTREWVVGHTSDLGEVRELVLAANPPTFFGLSRKSLQTESLGAPDLWTVTVEYGVSAVPDGLKPDELSFKIGAQAVHITQSKETLFGVTEADTVGGIDLNIDPGNPFLVTPDVYTVVPGDVGRTLTIQPDPLEGWRGGSFLITGAGGGQWGLDADAGIPGSVGGVWSLGLAPGDRGSAPDMGGAIGVTLDSVAGCDIQVPNLQFTYSRQRAFVDFAYIRTVRSLVGKTNRDTFFGFGPGTLLYMGCEPTSAYGQLDDGSRFLFWNLAHSFAQEDDLLAFPVGEILVPRKGGFEYLWARYTPTITAGQLGQRPAAVYVEKVYDEGDFALLEIGT